MAEKDVEIRRLLSEARVKSLEFARKQHRLEAAIERARAWKKYYEKKTAETKAKRDLAMLEYWRNELATWEALQKIRSSAAKYRRTHENADLLKMRMAQAEYYEKRVTIFPPEEAERAKKKLGLLQARIEKEKTAKYKHEPAGIVGYILLLFGGISLILSIPYTSSISAFVGLGLTFWGALLLYLTRAEHIWLAHIELLNAPTNSTLTNIEKVIANAKLNGKGIYLPPKHLKDFESSLIFIPSKTDENLPKAEEIDMDKVYSKKPKGLFLTPPGLALSKLFEKEIGTSFTKTDLNYIQDSFPKLLVEDMKIAENVVVKTENNRITIEITNHIFNELCKETRKLQKTHTLVGCPLCSAIACILAKATDKPITIEKEEQSQDGTTTKIQYRIMVGSK